MIPAGVQQSLITIDVRTTKLYSTMLDDVESVSPRVKGRCMDLLFYLSVTGTTVFCLAHGSFSKERLDLLCDFLSMKQQINI